MKNLVIIISVLVMFSSCVKEQIVHNRFVVFGDYTFEVLSGPDKDGDMKVKIVNRKDSVFSYLQHYNDLNAIKRDTYRHMYPTDLPLEFNSEETITLHKNSSLSIYPLRRNGALAEEILQKTIVFESATNFFNIY